MSHEASTNPYPEGSGEHLLYAIFGELPGPDACECGMPNRVPATAGGWFCWWIPKPGGAGMSAQECKHCGRAIAGGDPRRGWVHDVGPGSVLGRCRPEESGLPYGYNAEPVGTPCQNPCLGTRFPDHQEER